jgi:hypothetical protein
MRLMHTRLPDFYQKVEEAGKKHRLETEVTVRGLENYTSAKLASLRVGRVEDEISEIASDPNVTKVEVILMPAEPEITHTVVIKGYYADGSCPKAILEKMYTSSVTEDYELIGVAEIDDRRGKTV